MAQSNVRIIAPTWTNNYAAGDWVKLQGKVAKDRSGNLVITDVSMQKIDEPAPAYEFLGSL